MTTANHSQQIVQRLWNYCNVLRDDGLSYGDYVEQITYLLFLKMAHERTPNWSESNSDGRWCGFDYDEVLRRDKVSLDIFWLKGESLEDAAGLAEPDVIAAEIVEDLRAALEEFELIAADFA
jgi:type I restriction enzyme M protein